MSSKCPAVRVNMDAVVEEVKSQILGERKTGLVEGGVHRITGLGRIALIESNPNPQSFVIGFVTLPSVINFATKLMDKGVLLPKVPAAISRTVATGLTLGGTLLSGGKSFLLGALLGQLPTTLDTLAEEAVAMIQKGQMKGLGATSEERELDMLRQSLEKMSGIGEMEDANELEGTLVVR